MLVEQRTYELQPGTLHQFLHAYETEGLALQSAALGNLLGYFTTEVGELNCVVHLWGFDSYEDLQRRRSELSANPAWRAFLQKAGSAVKAQRNQLLNPTSFSPIR